MLLLQVDSLLHDLDDGMRPISVFFPYLPTAYHKKRDLARIELGKIFAKVGNNSDWVHPWCWLDWDNSPGGPLHRTVVAITTCILSVLCCASMLCLNGC